MKTKFIIPTLLMLCVWTGCQKQTVPEEDKGQDMHPFTEQELKKKQLDTAFSTLTAASTLLIWACYGISISKTGSP